MVIVQKSLICTQPFVLFLVNLFDHGMLIIALEKCIQQRIWAYIILITLKNIKNGLFLGQNNNRFEIIQVKSVQNQQKLRSQSFSLDLFSQQRYTFKDEQILHNLAISKNTMSPDSRRYDQFSDFFTYDKIQIHQIIKEIQSLKQKMYKQKVLILLAVLIVTAITQNPVICEVDKASTGKYLADDVCQCKHYHVWDTVSKACLPTCNFLFDLGKEDNNPKACKCREGSQWEPELGICVLKCEQIQYSTGQFLGSQICQCLPFSSWNIETLKCDLHCDLITNSDGTVDQEQNQCNCIQNFIWQDNQCLRDCESLDNSDGTRLQDGTCQCDDGAAWRYDQCRIIDCEKIKYTDGQNMNNQAGNPTCKCVPPFVWNQNLGQCQVDCQNINALTVDNQVSIHICECVPGAYWQQSEYRCQKDCSLIIDSTHVNDESDPEVCQCKVGYKWQSDNCVRDCGARIGQTGSWDTEGQHCQCDTGFFWNLQRNACYRDCHQIFYTAKGFGDFPDDCTCIEKYEWTKPQDSAPYCQLTCQGELDIGLIPATDGQKSQCQCQEKAFFQRPNAGCVLNCGKDPISTGAFEGDRCACIENAEWNDVQNECHCSSEHKFDTTGKKCKYIGQGTATSAVAGAIGGSVLAGSSVFMGMYLFNRKKSKSQQNQDAQESDKNIKQSDIVDIGNQPFDIPPRRNIQ